MSSRALRRVSAVMNAKKTRFFFDYTTRKWLTS